MPSLSLGYIAAYLMKYNKDIKIKIINHNVDKTINSFKPDLVGISSVSQNYNIAKKISKICKKYDLPVIIGGQHISALPESLSKEMDIGIMREGEETFLDIANTFQKHGWNMEKIRKIKGIAYHSSKSVVFTNARDLIEPLDKIPHPSYELLKIQKGGMFPVFSSRGCPYNCTFCSSTRFWNSVRFFSAEYVIREIKKILKEYKPNLISFQDDLFIADKKRLKKIVELIRKEGIEKKVNFHVSCRSNLINDEIVRLLKRMNVTNIGMGLESGCDKTLQWLKGNVSIKDNQKAVSIISKYNINVNATFIIGAPYESKKDIMKTYNFIKNSNINLFQVYGLVPYPGTPIWEYALKKNLVSKDMDWEKLAQDFTHNPEKKINLSEKVSKKELYNFYKKFERLRKQKYAKTLISNALNNPSQILPYLKRKIWEHSAI